MMVMKVPIAKTSNVDQSASPLANRIAEMVTTEEGAAREPIDATTIAEATRSGTATVRKEIISATQTAGAG
jgi:hypothetical protein